MRKFYMTFVLSFVFAALFVQGVAAQVWDGTSAPWTQGDGSVANPFLIETPQHLAHLSAQVATGETFEGKNFKLTSDLDMGASENKVFTRIGLLDKYFDPNTMQNVDASKYFKGTLDGAGHVIDNLKVVYVDEEGLGGTGLFACTTTSTVIRNLTLGANSVVNGGTVVGGFVGQMNGGTVENCCNKATINASNFFLGGIAGVMEGGLVTKCVNRGAINGTTEVGGIVGQIASTSQVTFCYNTAAVTAIGFGGAGIAGAMYESSVISNCYSAGKITGQSSPFLGAPHAITADAGTGTITNCYYEASLCGVDDAKATAKTAEEMGQQSFVDLLNAGVNPAPFVLDTKQANMGLPMLSWEVVAGGNAIQDVTDGVNALVNVNGNVVSATAPMVVYNLSGKVMAQGTQVTLEKGVYIIKCAGKAAKYIIK